MDRATGEVIRTFSVHEVLSGSRASRRMGKLVGCKDPVPGKATDVCPSVAGAKSWNSMAYSPRTGMLYVPALSRRSAASRPTEDCRSIFQRTGPHTGTWMRGIPSRGRGCGVHLSNTRCWHLCSQPLGSLCSRPIRKAISSLWIATSLLHDFALVGTPDRMLFIIVRYCRALAAGTIGCAVVR